jgi:alpha-tubulin suppressor-like RCC1 family protein
MKIIQITATTDRLFALTEDGRIFSYDKGQWKEIERLKIKEPETSAEFTSDIPAKF